MDAFPSREYPQELVIVVFSECAIQDFDRDYHESPAFATESRISLTAIARRIVRNIDVYDEFFGKRRRVVSVVYLRVFD